MAYAVSDKFREKVYSGESLYTYSITINGELVPETQVEKIEISNPIVDDEADNFYIGTFISQSLKIKFRNLDGLDIASGVPVELIMGPYINASIGYETIPIGRYIIDELAEDYTTKCEITCLDYGVKFKPSVDYTNTFYHLTTDTDIVKDKKYYLKTGNLGKETITLVDNPVKEDVSTYYENTGKATLLEILKWLCAYYEVELGTYPTVNNDVETSLYDNTLSGKRYISYIAEMFGGNAKIDRTGKLNIIPLVQSPSVIIDASKGKSWTLGEKYTITQVTWFDAIRKWSFGTTLNNTLMLRSENIFFNDESQVKNVYDAVAGFSIFSLEEENVADISLDAWDIIMFELDGSYYTTWNNSTITYQMSLMTKINTQIPTENVEVTTNILGTASAKYKRLRTDIDYDNNQMTLLSAIAQDNKEQIGLLKISVDNISSLFQLSGGTNLIKNSAFLLKDEVWKFDILDEDNYFHTELGNGYDGSLIGSIESKAKIELKNVKLTSLVSAENIQIGQTGTSHSFGYYYECDNNCTARVRLINDTTQEVVYDVTYNEATDGRTKAKSFSFVPTSPLYRLEIQSETVLSGEFKIYDMMLNSGETKKWEPASGEITSTILKMSQLGLQIISTGSDIATLMSADGFTINKITGSGENVQIGDAVTTFNSEGLQTSIAETDAVHTGKYILEERKFDNFEHHIEYFKE